MLTEESIAGLKEAAGSGLKGLKEALKAKKAKKAKEDDDQANDTLTLETAFGVVLIVHRFAKPEQGEKDEKAKITADATAYILKVVSRTQNPFIEWVAAQALAAMWEGGWSKKVVERKKSMKSKILRRTFRASMKTHRDESKIILWNLVLDALIGAAD